MLTVLVRRGGVDAEARTVMWCSCEWTRVRAEPGPRWERKTQTAVSVVTALTRNVTTVRAPD